MKVLKSYAPYGLVTLGMITKIAPHPYGVTATNSSLVYGPTAIKNIWTFIYPLILVFVSELIYVSLVAQMPISIMFPFVSNFISYIITTLVTKFFTHKDIQINYVKSGCFVALSSVQFFLISNLVVYLNYMDFYDSLIECYIAGLPFLGYELLGNIFYSIILFGAHYAINKYIPDEVVSSPEVNDEKLHSIISQTESA